MQALVAAKLTEQAHYTEVIDSWWWLKGTTFRQENMFCTKSCAEVQRLHISDKGGCSHVENTLQYVDPWILLRATTKLIVKIIQQPLGGSKSNCHIWRRFSNAVFFYTPVLSSTHFMLPKVNYIGIACLFLNTFLLQAQGAGRVAEKMFSKMKSTRKSAGVGLIDPFEKSCRSREQR